MATTHTSFHALRLGISHLTTAATMVFALSLPFVTSSCGNSTDNNEQLTEHCDSFARYYWNWHFGDAIRFCTPASEEWLRFAATGATQDDVDALRAKQSDATIEINHVEVHEGDTTATVSLTVHDFLQMDTIGKAAHPVEKAEYKLEMVLHNSTWKVKMEGLPRSEKKSLD